MRPRIVLAMFGVCAIVMIVAAPGARASYNSDGGLSLSNMTPSPGGSTAVTSSGWKPNSDVTITLHSTPVVLATVKADATGTVNTTVTIPSSASAGSHTIELAGTSSTGAPQTMSSPITVQSGGGDPLPRTGAAVAALVLVGIVLFVVGSALSSARKRALR
jgi:LPXTG-motif cell wall-anchored protein